jgi:hypothetical protein
LPTAAHFVRRNLHQFLGDCQNVMPFVSLVVNVAADQQNKLVLEDASNQHRKTNHRKENVHDHRKPKHQGMFRPTESSPGGVGNARLNSGNDAIRQPPFKKREHAHGEYELKQMHGSLGPFKWYPPHILVS